MPQKVIEYRQLFQILAMFMLVQFFGLLLATQVFTGATYAQIQGAQTISSTIDVLFYIGYIIIFSVIMLLILKIYKGKKLFLLLEAAVVVISCTIVFLIILSSIQGAVFSNLLGNNTSLISDAVFAIAVILAILLLIAKFRKPGLRNITAMIASVGVGVLLGISFSFTIALIFMVLIAIYDFIAVFITKHMIALADMAIDNNLSFLVMVNEIEAVPLNSLNAKEKAEYNKSKAELSKKGGITKKLVDNNMVPVSARTALGTGDLAIPLMLAVSAYKVHLNFVLSFVIILGGILGLTITMFILRKYKRALPAIPPLLFGIAIALITYFAFVKFY